MGPHQTWKTASGLKNKEQGEGNKQGKNKAEGGLLQLASARIWHKALFPPLKFATRCLPSTK